MSLCNKIFIVKAMRTKIKCEVIFFIRFVCQCWLHLAYYPILSVYHLGGVANHNYLCSVHTTEHRTQPGQTHLPRWPPRNCRLSVQGPLHPYWSRREPLLEWMRLRGWSSFRLVLFLRFVFDWAESGLLDTLATPEADYSYTLYSEVVSAPLIGVSTRDCSSHWLKRPACGSLWLVGKGLVTVSKSNSVDKLVLPISQALIYSLEIIPAGWRTILESCHALTLRDIPAMFIQKMYWNLINPKIMIFNLMIFINKISLLIQNMNFH